MRITRRQQIRQLGLELVDGGLEFGHLGGERRIVGAELTGRLEVTAGGFEFSVRGDDRRQLREPATGLARLAGVGVQRGSAS